MKDTKKKGKRKASSSVVTHAVYNDSRFEGMKGHACVCVVSPPFDEQQKEGDEFLVVSLLTAGCVASSIFDTTNESRKLCNCFCFVRMYCE